jgi:beta-galactosidase
MKLFSGQLTALAQSSETPGILTFEATATGVKGAKILIKTTN